MHRERETESACACVCVLLIHYVMKLMSNSGEQTCQICSENVGRAENGDPFVACDVCSFSVCRPWYEYETKYGNQSCPQCKTIYKGTL